MKTCSRCHESKPLSEFYTCTKNQDGLQYACKACSREGAKVSRLKHLDSRRAEGRKWYRDNIDHVRALNRKNYERRRQTTEAWNAAHPERLRAAVSRFRETPKGQRSYDHGILIRRLSIHGLTLDQYHSKAESQDFLCAICGEEPSRNRGGLHDGFNVDHDHRTNKIRGLLCTTCNVGIGMLKDSPDICQAAATYLSRHA